MIIDRVDVAFELERILPTAGEETIERVIDLFNWQLSLYRVDLEKQVEKHNETNRGRHKVCHKTLLFTVGLLAWSIGYIIYLLNGRGA